LQINNLIPISGQTNYIRKDEIVFDFIIISGDAYVDHPSFGVAIISRLLTAKGFKVGVIAQPDWKNKDEFTRLGRPKLAFLITGGNLDSMVNHYTVAGKRRKYDAYSPGGKTGLRPDRAVIVYTQIVKKVYGDVPLIIGGIEASLRRFAHYDYWDDKIRSSIIIDSGADLLIYGMGEKQIIEVAESLQSGLNIKDLTYIKGTAFKSNTVTVCAEDAIILPTFNAVSKTKKTYAKSFLVQYKNSNHLTGKTLVEGYDDNCLIIQNPPAEPLSTEEMDMVYRLPYTRSYHPVYEKAGGVPALTEVKFSIVNSRGCFGSCNFCSLHFHQGKAIQNRSIESVIEEAEQLTTLPDFKGYIHDVGGPTANFTLKACEKQKSYGPCTDKRCLHPKPCPNLIIDHSAYQKLLQKLRNLDGVKKVFIRSGIRHDYLLMDAKTNFVKDLCLYHVSGQLKVAPEHVSAPVLELMGKPPVESYLQFKSLYTRLNEKYNLKQYLVPYFMSSHPGSDLNSAIELALFIKKHEHYPEQVQDFYPTPGTLSTCIYYSGINPETGSEVYVPKSPEEKAMQRALIQFKNPKNYSLVYRALKKGGRMDLIGYQKKCLIRPPKRKKQVKLKK